MTSTARQPKTKFPLATAQAVADELVHALQPACARLAVAGSVRRLKAEVGDIELVYVPRVADRPSPIANSQADLFQTKSVRVNQVDLALADLLARGVIEYRPNVRGSVVWGGKNKLAVHVGSGIPVDFFSTRELCWYNYLVCRTGGAETNIRIATAALAKGWKWHPYHQGFTNTLDHWAWVHSERDVFEFVGLPYLEPHQR